MSESKRDPITIYAVVYSNYEPAEVDSLWQRREDAERRCDEANNEALKTGLWHVVEWTVK